MTAQSLSWNMPLILLGLIVLFSYTAQAITGFGSTVVALTLGVHLFTLGELLPVLVALNLPLCSYFVIRHGSSIDRGLLFRQILPWMTAGVCAGLVIFHFIPGPYAKYLFGILIVIFALRESARLLFTRDSAPAPMSDPVFRITVFFAGITHGMYASGGPLLVYAVSKKELTSAVFRSTLMAVWLVFNVVLIGVYFFRGNWTEKTTFTVLALLPLIPAGIWVGEILHHRISVRGFWMLVQAVLLVSGISFLIKTN